MTDVLSGARSAKLKPTSPRRAAAARRQLRTLQRTTNCCNALLPVNFNKPITIYSYDMQIAT